MAERTGGFQDPNINSSTSSPRNTQNQSQAVTRGKASDPYDKLSHTSIGLIETVHKDHAKVQIRLLGQKELLAGGKWIPVIQSIENIYQVFGQLRNGMVVQVNWVGKSSQEAKWASCIILAEETSNALSQEMHDNDVETYPYKLTGGGMSSVGP